MTIVARIRDTAKELQLALQGPPDHVPDARKWLEDTSHRPGCQCHKCFWAHRVIAGEVNMSFDKWRDR